MLGRYEAAGLPDLEEHLIGDPVLEALPVGQPLHMIRPSGGLSWQLIRVLLAGAC